MNRYIRIDYSGNWKKSCSESNGIKIYFSIKDQFQIILKIMISSLLIDDLVDYWHIWAHEAFL